MAALCSIIRRTVCVELRALEPVFLLLARGDLEEVLEDRRAV